MVFVESVERVDWCNRYVQSDCTRFVHEVARRRPGNRADSLQDGGWLPNKRKRQKEIRRTTRLVFSGIPDPEDLQPDSMISSLLPCKVEFARPRQSAKTETSGSNRTIATTERSHLNPTRTGKVNLIGAAELTATA